MKLTTRLRAVVEAWRIVIRRRDRTVKERLFVGVMLTTLLIFPPRELRERLKCAESDDVEAVLDSGGF